jgi:peptidoglycan/xylan/chitin deacetylase (PgdA/CDA1 family)
MQGPNPVRMAAETEGSGMGLGGVIKEAVSWCAPWALVVRGPAGGARRVAMTFDDGPHPENTPRILDALDAHGARATFFLQGDSADQHPRMVREIVRRGHEVGNHGYAHLDARAVASADYVADVLHAQATIEDILGQALPRIFRPPYGNVTPGSMLALLRLRFRFILWSLDSRDSFIRHAPALVDHVGQQRIEAGCIMLFHEDYGHTVEALAELIGIVKQRGMAPVTVKDLLSRAC